MAIQNDVPRVVNGLFDEPTLIGWEGRWLASGKLEATRDNTDFASGPASMRVDAARGANGVVATGTVWQRLSAPGGTRFVVAGKLKSTGQLKVSFAIHSFSHDGQSHVQQVAYTQDDSPWRSFGSEVTIPKDTVSFQLSLYVEGEGSAWLDDVELKEVK